MKVNIQKKCTCRAQKAYASFGVIISVTELVHYEVINEKFLNAIINQSIRYRSILM